MRENQIFSLYLTHLFHKFNSHSTTSSSTSYHRGKNEYGGRVRYERVHEASFLFSSHPKQTMFILFQEILILQFLFSFTLRFCIRLYIFFFLIILHESLSMLVRFIMFSFNFYNFKVIFLNSFN
jgi:hypothetical protein